MSILAADLYGPMPLSPESRKIYVETLTRSFALLHSDGTWENLPEKTMLWYLQLLRESNTLTAADLEQRGRLVEQQLQKRKAPKH